MTSRPPASSPAAPPAHAHRGVHAHRPVAGRAFGERGRDQRQRGGRDDRAAGALDGAGRQQPRLGGGQPAGEGRGGEQQQAGDEHPAPAEQVTGTAAEQQQAAERQGVAVHHPLQAGVGESQGRLDVRQRDVDDGRVEHDHQLRGRDDQQRHALLAAAASVAGLVSCGECRCHTCDAGGRRAPPSSPAGTDFCLISGDAAGRWRTPWGVAGNSYRGPTRSRAGRVRFEECALIAAGRGSTRPGGSSRRASWE